MSDDTLDRAGIEQRDLTERELADLERVKVRTVREWRVRGNGPPYRKLGPGRAAPVRYPVAEYRAWRSSTVVRSTASNRRLPSANPAGRCTKSVRSDELEPSREN
jgi:hypothetical protein